MRIHKKLTMAFGEIDELLAVMHTAFGVDAAQVRVDRALRDAKLARDTLAGAAFEGKGQNLRLTGGKPCLFADLASRGIESIERDGNLREL